MDGSQYHSNALNTNNSPYSSLPGISPHQLQHNSNLPPHTLPPLQPQHAVMQSIYGSAPHTPRTPATPNTPQSANTMNNYAQMGGQSRGYQMMPANSYQQSSQQYRTSSSMMPQASTAMSHPQPIAPAPAQARLPQALRPMPPNGLQHMQSSLQSPYGQNSMMEMQEQPTHVVGSQGRRGILPSAPGRPAVAATGTGSTKNAMIPAKDADGKFPCPHCTKTYLHAKHLKRHLLRHTGDRPYMCVLCRDTFSRSDILKRHFQKCSIRRGNPTGASHLSHAQAHLGKKTVMPHKNGPNMSNDNDMMNGMSNMSNDPALHPFGVIPNGSVPDAGPSMTDEQASQQHHLSRSNSLKGHSTAGLQDRRNLVGHGGSSRASFDYAGAPPSTTMPSGMNPSLAFSMPNGQNGHSYNQGYDHPSHNGGPIQPQSAEDLSSLRNGQGTMQVLKSANATPQSDGDWSQMFQQGPNSNFAGQYNNTINELRMQVKTEPPLNSTNTLFA